MNEITIRSIAKSISRLKEIDDDLAKQQRRFQELNQWKQDIREGIAKEIGLKDWTVGNSLGWEDVMQRVLQKIGEYQLNQALREVWKESIEEPASKGDEG